MKTFKELRQHLYESINDIATEFFLKVRETATIAHLLHLNSDSFSEHKALDEFYNGIIPLLDSFSEVFIGRHGKLSDYKPSEEQLEDTNPITLLKNLQEYIDSKRKELGTESELQNLIDSILELIDSTIYKLENLK